jgi:transposase
MHGGSSTGPRTKDGVERIRRASITHGQRTKVALAERQALRLLCRDVRDVLALMADSDAQSQSDGGNPTSPQS